MYNTFAIRAVCYNERKNLYFFEISSRFSNSSTWMAAPLSLAEYLRWGASASRPLRVSSNRSSGVWTRPAFTFLCTRPSESVGHRTSGEYFYDTYGIVFLEWKFREKCGQKQMSYSTKFDTNYYLTQKQVKENGFYHLALISGYYFRECHLLGDLCIYFDLLNCRLTTSRKTAA